MATPPAAAASSSLDDPSAAGGGAAPGDGGASSPKRKTKLVLLGETATGKTSIATRFAKKTFLQYQESTIGAAFLAQSVRLGGGYVVRFEIWDTAGQERYHSLVPMYYRGAAAAIVVYDVTSRASFERARDWVDELRREGPPAIVIALAGNKCDLSSKREVPEEEARDFAAAEGLLFSETSAKTDFRVDALFEMVAAAIRSADLKAAGGAGAGAAGDAASGTGVNLAGGAASEAGASQCGC